MLLLGRPHLLDKVLNLLRQAPLLSRAAVASSQARVSASNRMLDCLMSFRDIPKLQKIPNR
jgi:hypothetical protein